LTFNFNGFDVCHRNFEAKFFIGPSGDIEEAASELVRALFTAPRSATLSVEAALQALAHDHPPAELVAGVEGEGGGEGGSSALLRVVRDLCDLHLCPWFQLSAEDCGKLRMQVLMDVY
jgi:hypothetical protein